MTKLKITVRAPDGGKLSEFTLFNPKKPEWTVEQFVQWLRAEGLMSETDRYDAELAL